jgi:hypothetical protein
MKSILSKSIFFYFLFAIISLQVIFWFHGNNIINNNDFSFMLSPDSDTAKLFYRWDHTRGLGISQDRNAATLVYTSLLSVIYFFVNNISSVEKILFYIWVLFSFISVFTLIKFFLKKESDNPTVINIIAFIASLLYGMNPWLHNFRWGNGMLIAMFIYSIGPLILYFLLNILENKNKVFKNKYFIYFLLANIFALPSYENPAYFIAFYITVLIPLVLIYRKEIWKNKKLYLIYMVFFIIFNLWWVLRPISFFESSAYINASSPTSNNVLRSLDFRDSSFLELFRLQGFWASKFPEYFPYSTYYFKNGFIIFGSLFIFSLSFLFLFFRKRINYLIWFATFLFLFFILKGLHPPLDYPFEWLISNTWFRIFRMSMDKFGSMVILFFPLFLSLSLLRIYKFKKNIGIIIGLLAFFFILLNAYPFLINGVVPNNDAASRVTNGAQYLKKYYQIPDNYYNGIGSLAKKKIDRKYVIFPDNPDHVFSSWSMYEWSGITVDPLWNLLQMSPYLILNNHGNSIGISPQMSPFIQSMHKYYENNFNEYFKNIGKQLSVLNSDYIIFRNDNRNAEIYKKNKITREQIFNELNNNKDIKLISKSEELSVYKINSQFFSPHFYASKEIILTPNPVSDIPYIVSNPDYKIGSAIYSNKSPEDNSRYAVQKSIDNFLKDSINIYIKPFKYVQEKSNGDEQFNNTNEFILSDAQAEKNFNLYKLINETTPIIINYDKQTEKIIINIISENTFRLNDGKELKDKKILPLKEIKASEGEMLKIGKEYLIIDKNFSYETIIKDLPEEIKLYKTKKNSENLLTNKDRDKNNSFEQGLWRDEAQDCSNEMEGTPQLRMYLSDDATEGNKSLELGSKNHSSCTFKNFSIKLSKNKVYEYSFDYKNVKGETVQYYYNLIGKEKQSGFFETIDIKKNNSWNHFRTIIEPQEDAESIDLVFYAFSDGAEEIINRFDNVKLVESELDSSKIEILNNIVIQENIKLEKNNKIEYINPNKDSLVINASFEQGLWQNKITDCSQDAEGEPQMSMNLSDDATEGNKSLELGSKNHNACTFILFPAKLNKNKIYKYSFDYKNVKGKTVQYYYNLKGKEKQSDFIERIDVKINNNWNHFETFIEPQEDVEYIDLVFYAPSDGIEDVVNRYDNIKLEEWMPKDVFNYYLYSPAKEQIKTPYLEFKKINPTKYRVRVHQAIESFPLVFSESFHNGWKAYAVENKKLKIESNELDKDSNALDKYRMLDGNEDGQASKDELADYINKGLVSDIGDGKEKTITHNKWEDSKEKFDYTEKYNIDFISKNFQDTIQNDNLPKGSIFETWFKEPLAENNHLMANGYANSWWVDFEKVCGSGENGKCVKNPDGSYDFEMVIEFWPQRLFYIGLFVSGMTLLSCFGYLTYNFLKRKKYGQKN